MARKYKLLFKIQLYSLFDINRLVHSHDKKEKNVPYVLVSLDWRSLVFSFI